MDVYSINAGDTLIFKKNHPCGCNEWIVEKVGVDFKLRCKKCARIIIIPRAEIIKFIKKES